jgi:hypothetical protein
MSNLADTPTQKENKELQWRRISSNSVNPHLNHNIMYVSKNTV